MSESKKIMVVDDEIGIRTLLLEVLSEEGFKVTLAENGLDSLKKMNALPFDLVITDINMPGMDGIELLRAMKKKGRKEKIIIMTGESSSRPSNIKDLPPVESILKKPFHMSKLLKTVTSVLYP